MGDQGELNDVLEIDGQNVLTAEIAPRGKRVNAVFASDDGVDGVTDLSGPIADLFGLPFITGADLYLPAATPPGDTISVALTARAGDGGTAVVNVPNWASSRHHTSIQFRDFS